MNIKIIDKKISKRTPLFYMANLYPEIGRMFSCFDENKIEAANSAKIRALGIVDHILFSEDIKPTGREEWTVIKNLIIDYDKLDPYERTVLEKYAEPFAYKFMNSYSRIL